MKAQLLAMVLLVLVTAGSASAVTQFPNTSAPVIGKVKPVTHRALSCPGSAIDEDPSKSIGYVIDVSEGIACLGPGVTNLVEAFGKENIYPGNFIETEPNAIIEFKTLNVARCKVHGNSRLQIFDPQSTAGLAIKWMETALPADDPPGQSYSFCTKRKRVEGEPEKEYYGIGCKTALVPEPDQCKIVLYVRGTIFGVVLEADRDVIKVAEGSAVAMVADKPFMVKANEELRVPTAGEPTKHPFVPTDEEESTINRFQRIAATPNTPPTAFGVNSIVAPGGTVPITLQGSSDDDLPCDLIFRPSDPGPTSGELSPIMEKPCTSRFPNSDTAELTYTHDGRDTPSDSFTYEVCDSSTSCVTATVSITVSNLPLTAADLTTTVEKGSEVAITFQGWSNDGLPYD